MIKVQAKFIRFWNSKFYTLGIVLMIGLIVLIILIILAGIKISNMELKKKLIGSWNIEIESFSWLRDRDYQIGSTMFFQKKERLKLPILDDEKPILESIELSKGTWRIISVNPDSVFFNVPNHPLHGKYAIRFFIDEKGYRNEYINIPNLIYKAEFSNDSTWMICNKAGAMLKDVFLNWEK